MSDRPTGAVRKREIRFAVALAHSLPAVTLAVEFGPGSTLTVSRCRPADLDPCHFRSIVVRDLDELGLPGPPRLVDAITRIRLTSGPEHLGGGVYRYRDRRGEQRWFLTELDRQQVSDLLADCPVEGSDAGVTATTRADDRLGITAVRLEAAHPAAVLDLDRVAWWAVQAVLVAELVAECRAACR